MCHAIRVCLVALLLIPNAQGQEFPRHVLDRVRAVSVSIGVDGRFSGSGTLFDRDGETWCLTAQHVIGTGKSIRVSQHRGGKVISVYAEVFRQDEQRDVAILKLGKGVFAAGVTFHKGAAPELDTPVIHCGSMAGHHHTVTRGYLVGHDQPFQRDQLRDLCDLTGYYGSSGGGVFDARGNYVGMVVGGIEARLVYVVPVRVVEEVLR